MEGFGELGPDTTTKCGVIIEVRVRSGHVKYEGPFINRTAK